METNISKEDESINKVLNLSVEADQDKDKVEVSTEEVKQAIKSFFHEIGKPENPTVNSFFEKMIFQNKKTLTQQELLSRVSSSVTILMGLTENHLKAKFSNCDLDKDGKLNKEETSKLLEELDPSAGENQLNLLMSFYDKDEDGNISLGEFMEFAKKELLNAKIS